MLVRVAVVYGLALTDRRGEEFGDCLRTFENIVDDMARVDDTSELITRRLVSVHLAQFFNHARPQRDLVSGVHLNTRSQ